MDQKEIKAGKIQCPDNWLLADQQCYVLFLKRHVTSSAINTEITEGNGVSFAGAPVPVISGAGVVAAPVYCSSRM